MDGKHAKHQPNLNLDGNIFCEMVPCIRTTNVWRHRRGMGSLTNFLRSVIFRSSPFLQEHRSRVLGLFIGTPPNRRQAITWTSVHHDLQHHMASLGYSELTRLKIESPVKQLNLKCVYFCVCIKMKTQYFTWKSCTCGAIIFSEIYIH